MAIRDANHGDVAALMPLIRAYCDFYESNPPDAGLEEMARALIDAPEREGILLVATDGDRDEVVGFAACGWKWSSLRGARIVVLEDIYVSEDARGQGHADALIEAVREIARRHGAPAVTWLTAPDNHRAQGVYNRAGGVAETYLEYELET